MKCQHYSGEHPNTVHCRSLADVLLVGPEGDKQLARHCASFYCRAHAVEISDEYRAKLGEDWQLVPVDANGLEIPEEADPALWPCPDGPRCQDPECKRLKLTLFPIQEI